MQPLEGVRVVSIEQAVAAPLCSKRLLLAGAEVFKVERPEGDFARFYDTAVAGESSYFVWLNGGKKSVVFDLREAEDVRLLEKLISRCDVLVQNLKPGALEKLGLGLTELHARYPHLISVSISGFHPDGPGAQRKAYDLLMQAEAGLASITGSMEAPGRVGVSIVDIATGMFAYEAVLEAVLLRHHSGTGERISVALFDAVAQYMSVPYLLTRYGGGPPARVGLAHPGICPYGVFESADQIAFVLSVQNEAEWQRLCQIDGSLHTLAQDKRCADNETRVAHRAFVDATLQVHFASTRYVDLAARLDAADVAFAPVNGVPELVNHADLRTTRVAVNSASIELPVVPGRAINAAADSDLEMPDIGAHTEEVLQWLRDG
ncbi:MAG: CoA transferase [Pseudomonadaceae bacterium]|nr:CoA transferase [Pseudomonadaceae bacterium]